MEWYTDQSNVLLVADWLREHDGETIDGPDGTIEPIYDVDSLHHLIEKPWHFDSEYHAAEAQARLTTKTG